MQNFRQHNARRPIAQSGGDVEEVEAFLIKKDVGPK
jgi:hypothetical protein